MTQYAQYNPAVPAPSPVTGWYDTVVLAYANLPAATDLLEVTATEWSGHFANPSGWAVSGTVLVAYAPPTPTLTLAQQAQAALSSGLAVTSASASTLDATYPCDPTTQSHIQAEMLSVLVTGAFADGTDSLVWPDTTGAVHTFTVTQFKELAIAVSAYVAALYKVINGTLTALPAASATIA